MSLRKQLLLVSLLTLFLPWAGCQYITELETALRQGQQKSLMDSANALASILQERRQLLYRFRSNLSADADPVRDLYAHPLTTAITIDGYNDEWGLEANQLHHLRGGETTDGSLAITFAVGADRNFLYLFLEVTDDQVTYRNDARGPVHDAIALIFWDSMENFARFSLETDAPGEMQASEPDAPAQHASRARQVLANWQQTSTGYHVEMRIPQSITGPRFGFAVIDGDAQPLDPLPYLGTIDPYDPNPLPGLLVQPLPELTSNVNDLSQRDRRLRIVDRHGWVLAEGGQLRPALSGNPQEVSLLDRVYRRILDPGLRDYPDNNKQPGKIFGPEVASALQRGVSDSIWYQPEDLDYAVISAAAPIYDGDNIAGALILEQTSAETLLLTNNALTRILSVTLFSTAFVVAGLLGFATLLSLRIRRLRNATEHAMEDDGRLHTDFPGASARDELGDLSRSFKSLLLQLNAYTEYLKSLASKLSHELRTPLAVVQSSLDNLHSQELGDDSKVYAQRATAGVARLRHIVSAMSAASRVEQSIATAEFDRFDLARLIFDLAHAYQDTYADRVIVATGPDDPCPFSGVADLLAQMIDKLIENAVDFTPAGGVIQFNLEQSPRHYVLAISNEGPPLPANMADRLFDSLISVRDAGGSSTDSTHLGFGLYIAKLVVQLHSGTISAHNLRDGGGVEFKIVLPRHADKAT
ncbi:MAG: HAMP domain-containing protein [Gammaproteobacteria bacterium]|nr:HAMP domain-containing protein [Gammaproteobacteria bacterium]